MGSNSLYFALICISHMLQSCILHCILFVSFCEFIFGLIIHFYVSDLVLLPLSDFFIFLIFFIHFFIFIIYTFLKVHIEIFVLYFMDERYLINVLLLLIHSFVMHTWLKLCFPVLFTLFCLDEWMLWVIFPLEHETGCKDWDVKHRDKSCRADYVCNDSNLMANLSDRLESWD